MTRRIIYILLVFFSLAGFISLSLEFKKRQLEKRRIAWQVLEEKIKKTKNIFGQKIAIVIKDFSSGRQILINEDNLFPAASLIKIPIMASLFYVSSKQKIDLNKTLLLQGKFKVLGSGILKSYPNGTSIPVEKLIALMISESDNTAANMLIDYMGFDYLNSSFRTLGLNHTSIARKMMDFKSRRDGKENFTTASDLAFILDKIYRGRLINRKYSQKGLTFLKQQKIRDRIPAKLPPNIVVAHKTGLERGICHDAGIVFTPGGDFLICVLTKHQNKTSKAAKEFISSVALEVYNYAGEGT